MSNELYTFAKPVQVVPFSSLKWGKFTLLHTIWQILDFLGNSISHLTEFSEILLDFGTKIQQNYNNNRPWTAV